MGKNFGVMYTTRIVWDFASGLRIAKNEWEGLLQKKITDPNDSSISMKFQKGIKKRVYYG